MAWKYFTENEMRCNHCGQYHMDEMFMSMLDSLRKAVGSPLTINSGYRCLEYDMQVGGKGNHSTGKAVDIKCDTGGLRFSIIKEAMMIGFRRIGIGDTFVHIDHCHDKPQEVIWLY